MSWLFLCIDSFFRNCDSRNLNLSPFCNLRSAQSLAKWQPALKSTYENITADYLDKLQGPMRLKYPGSGKSSEEGELLTFLTEVVFHPNLPIMFISITVFSLNHWCNTGGQQILQCIWKGHCRGEHLFWKLNCLWFGKVFHNYRTRVRSLAVLVTH